MPGVDILSAHAYVRFVMLRRLLACFALLTGLAAAGAPAQAEIAALASQIEASTSNAAEAQAQAKEANPTPVLRGDFSGSRASKPVDQRSGIVPTVRLGSDRARE